MSNLVHGSNKTTSSIGKIVFGGFLFAAVFASSSMAVLADDDKSKAPATAVQGAASNTPASAPASTGSSSGSSSEGGANIGNPGITPPPADGGTDAGSSGATAPMQAGVQMIELNLQMLTQVGLDIKNLLKSTGSLYDEVTIQPVSVITEPEVVGRGIIINIPVGTRPVGPPAPPKKARVDLAMNQIRPIVTTLKQDVDEFETGKARLDISDDTRKDLHPYFDSWIKTVNDINTNMKQLESVTTGPPYDNSSIAQAAGTIHQDAQRLDEVRRKIYKYLQKEGKQKKKKNA